jgi:hypothetical protein
MDVLSNAVPGAARAALKEECIVSTKDTAEETLLREPQLSVRCIVVASKEQISCDLMDGNVILDLTNGVYYGLDSVGSRIWSLLQETRTVGDIRDILLSEYDVEPDRCERDLLSLLETLKSNALIDIVYGDAA